MKITLPNGTIIEATMAELVEARQGITAADETLKTVFGDEAASFWDLFKSWAGLK